MGSLWFCFIAYVCLFCAVLVNVNGQILPRYSDVHSRKNTEKDTDFESIDRFIRYRPKLPSSVINLFSDLQSKVLLTLQSENSLSDETITVRLSVASPDDNKPEYEKNANKYVQDPTESMKRPLDFHSVLNTGEVLLRAGRLVEAEELYLNSLHNVTQLVGLEPVRSTVYSEMTRLLNQLAIVAHSRGMWRVALNALSVSVLCFDRSVSGIETSEDTLKRAKLVSNMGNVAMGANNFEAALMYFHDVLLGILHNSDELDISTAMLIGKTYVSLGGAYIALDDVPQAMVHYKEGVSAFRSVYDIETMENAVAVDAYVASIHRLFFDDYHVMNSKKTIGSLTEDYSFGDCYNDFKNKNRDQTEEITPNTSSDLVRHIIVSLIAIIVTGSGVMTLILAPDSYVSGIKDSPAVSRATLNAKKLDTPVRMYNGLTPSSGKRRRVKTVVNTPVQSDKGRPNEIECLAKEEEIAFAVTESNALDMLRNKEFTEAADFITKMLHQHFGARINDEHYSNSTAHKIVECRLRYMLSKALCALEKFYQGEEELYLAVDTFLNLGVLDDVAVAALLDYSLLVLREQLYDENGNENYTPDRFVRAHNTFCSILFSPKSSVCKVLPFQRFQVSGPVDESSVEEYGFMSPAGVRTASMMINSPLVLSPNRSIVSDCEKQNEGVKYRNANAMLRSLEKVFYENQKTKEEMGTLANMCSEFEILAEEMDRCLNDEDFSICLPRENVSCIESIECQREVLECSDAAGCNKDPVDCVDTMITRLGSTTGDDFDGDTFDDLFASQDEVEGDLSRVEMVQVHGSPGYNFGSDGIASTPQQAYNIGTDNFYSPDELYQSETGTSYLHLRDGIALNDSEAKENNHSCSIAMTDTGNLTDNSKINCIASGGRGGRKKRKHFTPSKSVMKPIR